MDRRERKSERTRGRKKERESGGGTEVERKPAEPSINPGLNYYHYCNGSVMFSLLGPVIVTKPGVQKCRWTKYSLQRKTALLSMVVGGTCFAAVKLIMSTMEEVAGEKTCTVWWQNCLIISLRRSFPCTVCSFPSLLLYPTIILGYVPRVYETVFQPPSIAQHYCL